MVKLGKYPEYKECMPIPKKINKESLLPEGKNDKVIHVCSLGISLGVNDFNGG